MPGIVWKRWNWLEIFLLPFSVALMQVVCVAPIFAALLREPTTGITETGFVFWLCLGIMMGGSFVGRLAAKNRLGPFIVVLGALIAVIVSWMMIIPSGAQAFDQWLLGVLNDLRHTNLERMPLPLLGVVVAVFNWWRGLRANYADHEKVLLLFGIGLVVQLIILFFSFRSASRFSGALMLQVLLFLAASMAAFSFSQIARTMREQQRRTGTTVRIDRYWVGTVGSVIVMLILVGLLVTRFVSPASLRVFKPLWDVLVQIVLLIVYVLAFLFFNLIGPLFERLPQERRPMAMPFQSPLSPEEMMEQLERQPAQVPPVLLQIFQTVLILAALLLVVWIMVRALRKRKEVEQEDGVIEERESILSAELLRDQFANLFDGLRRRRLPPFLDLSNLEDTRRLVRQVYQDVLARAAALEAPRRWGQTPDRYEEEILITLYPGERDAWDTITQVYDIARYGDDPPTTEQAQAVVAAYERLAPMLNKAIEARNKLS